MFESNLKSIGNYSIACFVFIALAVAYSATIYEISLEWSGNGVYSHGFLALLIAAYITYQSRDKVSNARYRFNLMGLIAIIATGSLWLAAALINVQLIQVFCLFIIIVATLVCLFGFQSLWALKIALLALLLVLPVWNFLQVPLQILSSDVTYAALKLLDIPTLREGFRFTVPGGQFIIEEACSGLSFFLSSCLLSVLFVHFNHVLGIKRLYFILFAILLSLVSNWIRIVFVILVGNYTRMDHFIVQDHLTFGWILYAVMLIPFFVVGHFMNQFPTLSSTDQEHLHNQDELAIDNSVPGNAKIVAMVTAVALITYPTIRLFLISENHDSGIANTYDTALGQLAQSIDARFAKTWNPRFAGADETDQTSIRYGTQIYRSLRVTYLTQTQGKELVFVKNTPFAEDQWLTSSTQFKTVELNSVTTNHKLTTLRDRRGTERYMVSWYFIGGRVTTNEREAKLFEFFARLAGDGSAHFFAFVLDEQKRNVSESEFPASLLDLSSEMQSAMLKDYKL